MPFIQFPDVPQFPGVPQLLRMVGTPVIGIVNAALIRVGLGQFALGLEAPQWGIFDSDGKPMAMADTVLGIEFRNDSRVSNYPQEKGAFASYNKVGTPYESRIRLVKGGTETERTQFLLAIETAQRSTNLYNIVTPERTYKNANVVVYDYRRETQSGVTLLIVDLFLVEVRQVTVSPYSSTGAAPIIPSQTSSPGAASPQNQGQVQPSATAPSATISPTAVQ